MSYLTTKLNGIIRSRLLIRRIITKNSSIHAANSGVHTVASRQQIPDYRFTFSPNIHQLKSYSTVQINSEKKPGFDPKRIQKILTKLSSNKVSLQFDEFVTVRPNLFRNYSISVANGFEILKSCSQLVDRSADERIRLVNECWNELLSIIGKPTKDQLILLLEAYRRAGLKSLDNYQSLFEKYDLAIDGEIFAEIMYITCQNGDTMEAAEALLNDMTLKNIQPNEQVYNALILGYSKQGIEAVENVLKTMESKDITPSLSTTTELIKAYSVNGMGEKAIDILQRAEGFSSDQLYDIIRCASIQGNEKLTEKALSFLPATVRNAKLIVPQLQNICIELIYLNRERSPDAKLDPYQLIIRHLPAPDIESECEYGMFLLKEMIVANESVANILRFCEDLIEDNRNLYPIHNCCMYSMVFNLPTARNFLEALAAKESLRPHYFWPMLVRTNNQTEVIDLIKFVQKLNVILDTKTLQTYVLPRVNTLIDSQETIKALTDVGVRMLELKTALIAYLLENNRPKEAVDIATRSSSTIDPAIIIPALNKFIKSPKYKPNVHTIITLIKKLQSRCIDKSYDLSGQTILSVCNNRDKNDDFLLTKRLLSDYERFKVNISPRSAKLISEKVLKNRSIYAALSPIIQNITSDSGAFLESESMADESKPPKQGTEIEDLEQQLSEFKANNLPIHGVLYRLLLKLVQSEQYDRALEVKEQCDKNGVIETPAVLSTLIKLWTATKNPDKALDVLRTLQTKHPNFKLDSHKVVDLATLLITESRVEHAEKLINDLPKWKNKSITYISNNLWRLLDAAVHYGVENSSTENMAGKFLKKLIDKGYCEHSNTLLGCVIKEYLEKKQIREAIAAFEQYVNMYQKTPQTLSLLTLLIELSNDEKSSEYSLSKEEAVEYLQQMIELLRQIHGTENTNVNIILAFACAGNEQQLRKILMNPVVRFNTDVLLKSLNYLKGRARIEAVVALARSARGLQHESLDEEKLYEFLLSDFVRTNDYAAAIRLYEHMQNDDSSLISKKFSRTLSDLLVKNNQPIPEKLGVKTY